MHARDRDGHTDAPPQTLVTAAHGGFPGELGHVAVHGQGAPGDHRVNRLEEGGRGALCLSFLGRLVLLVLDVNVRGTAFDTLQHLKSGLR